MVVLTLALATSASAQFSVSGPGSFIPASGTGGDDGLGGTAVYDTVQPGLEAASSVMVPSAVTGITSIDIQGLAHSWVGDTQATLEDPNGVEHLIWLRPGYLNTGNFGASGDFDGGNYTFVGDGSGASLPTTSTTNTTPAGTYNQSFNSGGTTWVSGTNGINNTPMNTIAGPAGMWTLHIYDWAGGDTGDFQGWTLNGNNGPGLNSGNGYCFGDGSGTACPCGANGATGEGCMTTSGSGAALTGVGNADTSSDTFSLNVSGLPTNKPGLFFQGTTAMANAFGDGILCSNSTSRFNVQFTAPGGSVSMSSLGSQASSGATLNYQYWFRDPGNSCGGGFNFSNAWTVTWL